MYKTAEIKEYGARNFYIYVKFLPFDNDDISHRNVKFLFISLLIVSKRL